MKVRTLSSRAMAWLGLAMLLLSLTPFGMEVSAARQAGMPVVQGDVAQGTESFLEVHVSECDPGTTGTPQQLRDICHDNGLAGVTMTVASVDPVLGIDQPKTTERVSNAGPGIINTGTIPPGDYRVQVDLPAEGNTFVVGCEFFDRDETVPATPANAATFNVTVPQGEDIVCDLYVIPVEQADPASIQITLHQCERGDLPADSRTFADLQGACGAAPAQPVELTLADGTGTQVQRASDAAGMVLFGDLQPGTYELFSELDGDEWGEYLFCTLDGGERYEKDFDNRGVTTFANVEREQIACDWFAVQAPQETSEPQGQPEDLNQDVVQVDDEEGGATLLLHVNTCEPGYDATGAGFETFSTDCDNRTANVGFTVEGVEGDTYQADSDAAGNVTFTGLLGDYDVSSNVPGEAATEYLFCSVDGGPVYQKEFTTSGVTTFTNILPDESIECSWYIVPEDLRGDETGGTVTVHLAACPEGYEGSDHFNDCHDNGVADMPFTLSGAATEITANTVIEETPGPGVVEFTSLPAGEYTLAGGPPQDFGTVVLYCTDEQTSERIDATMEGGIARFALAGDQNVLCDWYFIPEDARGDVTPTPMPTQQPTPAPTPQPTAAPTQAPQRAEILVTLFECDPALSTAGASFGHLDRECDQPINDVRMSLSMPGGTPISAETGVSGDGAVRFYDLRPGDYVMTPDLPDGYTNTAVFCQIGNGDVYQKPIQRGSTTFMKVDGEQIACSWFATAPAPVPAQPQQPAGPSGSITIRELLCEGDASSITDWERECVPGSTGTAYSIRSGDGSTTRTGTPGEDGVLVFGELPDGYYELEQEDGVWCRAAAERVDSRSRVIVSGGVNTDVFLYQCNQAIDLPSTGTGAAPDDLSGLHASSLLLAMLSVPLFGAALWQHQRAEVTSMRANVSTPADRHGVPGHQAQSDAVRFR